MAGGRAGKKTQAGRSRHRVFWSFYISASQVLEQRGLNTKQGWKMGSLCAIKYTQERMMWGCGVVCYKGLLVDCLRLTARRKTWDLVCGGGNPCCGYGLTIVPTWWLFSTVGLVLFWQPEGLDYMGSCSSVSSPAKLVTGDDHILPLCVSFHTTHLLWRFLYFDSLVVSLDATVRFLIFRGTS